MAENTKPLPLLSRRLRRLQDALGWTNETAASFFGIPLRTYTNALLGEHLPRGAGKVHFNRLLTKQETKLQLPPLTNETQC